MTLKGESDIAGRENEAPLAGTSSVIIKDGPAQTGKTSEREG